jgi:hypothetical protein
MLLLLSSRSAPSFLLVRPSAPTAAAVSQQQSTAQRRQEKAPPAQPANQLNQYLLLQNKNYIAHSNRKAQIILMMLFKIDASCNERICDHPF